MYGQWVILVRAQKHIPYWIHTNHTPTDPSLSLDRRSSYMHNIFAWAPCLKDVCYVSESLWQPWKANRQTIIKAGKRFLARVSVSGPKTGKHSKTWYICGTRVSLAFSWGWTRVRQVGTATVSKRTVLWWRAVSAEKKVPLGVCLRLLWA